MIVHVVMVCKNFQMMIGEVFKDEDRAIEYAETCNGYIESREVID
jgi:hypothetical protein